MDSDCWRKFYVQQIKSSCALLGGHGRDAAQSVSFKTCTMAHIRCCTDTESNMPCSHVMCLGTVYLRQIQQNGISDDSGWTVPLWLRLLPGTQTFFTKLVELSGGHRRICVFAYCVLGMYCMAWLRATTIRMLLHMLICALPLQVFFYLIMASVPFRRYRNDCLQLFTVCTCTRYHQLQMQTSYCSFLDLADVRSYS